MRKIIGSVLITLLINVSILHGQEKPFIHPGMAQSRADMEHMKKKVLAGEQPWKDAFERLKTNTSLSFTPQAFTHVSVGPYNTNSIGGKELEASANASYNNALLWYITGNKAYAQKAIEILNAWAYTLWDLDDNNAKLNVGLTAYYFLNAAEILKYTKAGWKQKDMDQFKRMMLTVYYPTVKDFFTEANGNWDASIINTMLCIGIFTNDHRIFNRALERYEYGPNNSGVIKYIYPSGQIQETTRDWGHVQLGIGELEKAAQVAYTQGRDLYATANNRLALGYEYTAKYMLGEDVPIYGIISPRDRGKYRDIYESIYQHYQIKGIKMPYVERVVKEHTRSTSSTTVLTSLRAPVAGAKKTPSQIALPVHVILNAGAIDKATAQPPVDAESVAPGDSIQAAIQTSLSKSKWVVLQKGVFILKTPLLMPSGITLSGQGNETIITLAPNIAGNTIVNATNDMHDVTIRDLLLEGATSTATGPDPNAGRRTRSYMSASSRAGIQFSAEKDGQMHHIRFEHVTVQNCTKSGVSVRGASNVIVNNCNFSDNGGSVVPGAGLMHNLHLTHVDHIEVRNSRFDNSPWGSGIDVSFCRDAAISNNELARNKLNGIRFTESNGIKVIGNLAEGNDDNGIQFETLMDACTGIEAHGNFCQYNGNRGINPDKGSTGQITHNRVSNNRNQ